MKINEARFKKPKVILKFCPDPDFKEQFANFVGEILSREQSKNKSEIKKSKK